MGFEDDFDKIDKLLSIVPLTNLKCPQCKTSDKENFELVYAIRYRCPIDADGPAKIVEPDYQYETFVETVGNPWVMCDKCGNEFPLPDEWRIHVRKTDSERPGETVTRQSATARWEAAEAAEKAKTRSKYEKPTDDYIMKGQ